MARMFANTVASKYGSLIQTHSPSPPRNYFDEHEMPVSDFGSFHGNKITVDDRRLVRFSTATPMMMRLLLCDTPFTTVNPERLGRFGLQFIASEMAYSMLIHTR